MSELVSLYNMLCQLHSDARVAIGLCKVLFDVPRVNDALLFMTILSTDLRALRRRGYNGARQ